jgi:hypothetical protein
MALLWAAGIIWFAVDFAGGNDAAANTSANDSGLTDATGQPVTNDNVQQFSDTLNSM